MASLSSPPQLYGLPPCATGRGRAPLRQLAHADFGQLIAPTAKATNFDRQRKLTDRRTRRAPFQSLATIASAAGQNAFMMNEHWQTPEPKSPPPRQNKYTHLTPDTARKQNQRGPSRGLALIGAGREGLRSTPQRVADQLGPEPRRSTAQVKANCRKTPPTKEQGGQGAYPGPLAALAPIGPRARGSPSRRGQKANKKHPTIPTSRAATVNTRSSPETGSLALPSPSGFRPHFDN